MKIKQPVVYLLASLVIIPVLLLVLFFYTKQSAIYKAQRFCGGFHATQQEPPYNIKTELLSCSEVEKKIGWNACAHRDQPSILMWFITMDGSWLIQGPPNANGTLSMPIPFSHCYWLMNAITGEDLSTGNR